MSNKHNKKFGARTDARQQDRDVRWPNRDKLAESVDAVWKFQQMCKLQLDLGYWVTMDFPTKHHINKILSVQYIEKAMVDKVYGSTLAKMALDLIPACRNFIAFTKGTDEKLEANRQTNNNS